MGTTPAGGADALTVIVQADTAIVVGSAEAAKRLNTSEDRVRQFVRAGLIATVPHLSTDAKLAIAVSELERFAAQGTVLRSVAS